MLTCLCERQMRGRRCRRRLREWHRAHVIQWSGGGVAEAKIVSRRARPLLVVEGGAFTRLEVGADEADAATEAKWISRVTLLLLGIGADFSKSDTVPLVVVICVDFALLCCGRVAEEAPTGDVALGSWVPTSVEVRCCMRGGGRSKLYGHGSPLRMKVIGLEGEKVDSAPRSKKKQSGDYSPLYDTRQWYVLFSSESEPKNQNMAV